MANSPMSNHLLKLERAIFNVSFKYTASEEIKTADIDRLNDCFKGLRGFVSSSNKGRFVKK
jgi:hypothetical protein